MTWSVLRRASVSGGWSVQDDVLDEDETGGGGVRGGPDRRPGMPLVNRFGVSWAKGPFALRPGWGEAPWHASGNNFQATCYPVHCPLDNYAGPGAYHSLVQPLVAARPPLMR